MERRKEGEREEKVALTWLLYCDRLIEFKTGTTDNFPFTLEWQIYYNDLRVEYHGHYFSGYLIVPNFPDTTLAEDSSEEDSLPEAEHWDLETVSDGPPGLIEERTDEWYQAQAFINNISVEEALNFWPPGDGPGPQNLWSQVIFGSDAWLIQTFFERFPDNHSPEYWGAVRNLALEGVATGPALEELDSIRLQERASDLPSGPKESTSLDPATTLDQATAEANARALHFYWLNRVALRAHVEGRPLSLLQLEQYTQRVVSNPLPEQRGLQQEDLEEID